MFMTKLIVSLTSYPTRINGVYKTIESIINQTLKPDIIVLWLCKDEFKNNEIPNDLLGLIDNTFKIEWIIESLKSYTKLVPSLEKFPNDIIVTVDDDVCYDKNWLKILFENYVKNPGYIHAHRCHKILFDNDGNLKSYNKWAYDIKYDKTKPSYLNFITGVGGCLYPPNSLHSDILNCKLFRKLCPTGDDIWFWAMALLNKTKINLVENNLGHPEWNKNVSQEKALSKVNRVIYDQQIKNVIDYYPNLRKIIKIEFKNSINYKDYKLFNLLNLLSIRKYSSYTSILIFKYIQILKIKKKLYKTYIKLFGFIPLFKIKKC